MAKGIKGPKGQNQMNMMKQLQQLQQQIETTQAELAEETVEVSVGGGAVKVIMTGDQHCRAVELDQALLEDADPEMLQDLLLTAFNSALDKSREMAADRLGPLAGGLPI
jgi:DNA-binding YbaB/EbfC family protein